MAQMLAGMHCTYVEEEDSGTLACSTPECACYGHALPDM